MDFDKVINRRNTNSSKWDLYPDGDVIPMWVADMDFAAPEPILDAVRRRLDHPVIGYTKSPAALDAAIVRRMREAYGWERCGPGP